MTLAAPQQPAGSFAAPAGSIKSNAAEATESGFAPPELLAVEGPAWAAQDFDTRWQDPARRQQLLNLVRTIEHEPALLGELRSARTTT